MALDFVAGCLGGCSGIIVGHPFDTVKVRLQTQSTSSPLYRGILDCFVKIVKKESPLGLYKGMASPLYGVATINAIVFGVQGNVQRRMDDPDSLSTHFVAGWVGGVAQSLVCSPTELAKTRLQIQGQGKSQSEHRRSGRAYSGPVDCLVKIYRREGVRGVYRGLWLTCARDAPSFAFYFLSFEWLCRVMRADDEAEVGALGLLVAGGMAGITAWVVTYPLDVIKSKIQADARNRYTGFVDCCVQSYRAKGVHAFTTGFWSTVLRAFPTNAATLATVTLVRRYTDLD